MPDTLYANVELVPSDTGAGEMPLLLGVSMTIKPESLPASATTACAACPWTWDGIDINWKGVTWNVYGRTDDAGSSWAQIGVPGDGITITVYPFPQATEDNRWLNNVRPRLLATINKALKDIQRVPDAAAVPGGDARVITISDDSFKSGSSDLGYGQKYLSMLLDLAAGPYPIAQLLNLSCFLKISGVKAGYTKFLALPSFSASGKPYAPDASVLQPPVGTPVPDLWESPAKNGVAMHAEFSNPVAGFIQKDLWLQQAAPANNQTLVAGWQGNVGDLAGPYVDVAHLLTDPSNPAPAASLANDPANGDNWLRFRECVLNGLLDLVCGTDTKTPTAPALAWRQTLRDTLKGDFKTIRVLGDSNQKPPDFATELLELQRVVNAACNGENLAALVLSQKVKIPARYTPADQATILLRLLQSHLLSASQVVSICNDNSKTSGVDAAADKLTALIRNRLTSKLQDLAQSKSLVDGTMDFLGTTVKRAMYRLAFGTTDPGKSAASTSAMPPLMLQALPAQTAATGNLLLRGIRGVSAVLRRKDADNDETPWKCPGIASPDLQDATLTGMLPVLVATRLFYTDGDLLTSELPYNNGPFACANILHEYMGDNQLQHDSKDSIPGSVLQYVSYEGAASLRGTPLLRAGSHYDYACFAVSNSGALPPSLREDYPARFRLDTLADPAAYTTEAYFRTVSVAGFAVTSDAGDTPLDQSNPFPSIPENVWPLATEIPFDPPVAAAGASVDIPQRPPLLLLTPARTNLTAAAGTRSAFQYSVRLPVADPVTWYATNGYQLPPDQGSKIMDHAYLLLKDNHHAPITDPLVDSVVFSLQQWNGTTWDKPATSDAILAKDLLNPDPLATIPGAETLPIHIRVDSGSKIKADGSGGDDGAITFQVGSQPAKLLKDKLAGGSVYLFKATVNLNKALTARTMPNFTSTLVGYQALIEIATAAMPEPESLLAKTKVTLLASGGLPDQQLQMKVQAENLPNIHRVDFLRQNWEWTGRVQPQIGKDFDGPQGILEPQPYPFDKRTLWPAWETVEFAEHPTIDHFEHTSVAKRDSKTGRYFELVEDLSHDLRATHLRLAPRVYSRYQGLYDGTNWFYRSSVGNAGKPDQWNSQPVRSRQRNLKMPRLKALIPFTESAFPAGPPGIVAIFDGPAFDQAGLAERLSVSYATVADPDTNVQQPWKQTGPDFLMGHVESLQKPSQQTPPELIAIGPAGHTLDNVSGIHRFGSHSWIIRPKYESNKDFAWWFAELNFHLEIIPEVSVFPPAGGTAAPTPIRSETVTGSWIQFLPGFHNDKNEFGGWSFITGTDGLALTFRVLDAEGNPVTPALEMHASRFLFVTRIVRDITGIQRESYFGIAAHTGAGDFWTLLPEIAVPDQASYRVRMMYVRTGDTAHLSHVIQATDMNPHAAFWETITRGAHVPGVSGQDPPTDMQRAVPVNLSAYINEAGAQ